MTSCGTCARPLPPHSGRGQPRRYCSDACRVAAYRGRQAGETAAVAETRAPWVADGLDAFIERLMEQVA